MKKSVAVLGLGRYGTALVKALYEMGADILAADQEEKAVKEIAEYCTTAVCADLSDEENLLSLGLTGMDIVVVAMGRSLEASILSVSVSKELGIPLVVAKSSSDRVSSILKKVGADRVIIPEEYAGERWAKILMSETVLDYFEVDSGLCMIEMKPLKHWVGKSVKDLDLRRSDHINVLAAREENKNWVMVDPDHVMAENCSLLAVMERKTLDKLTRGE